jgi:hypothetical protein
MEKRRWIGQRFNPPYATSNLVPLSPAKFGTFGLFRKGEFLKATFALYSTFSALSKRVRRIID